MFTRMSFPFVRSLRVSRTLAVACLAAALSAPPAAAQSVANGRAIYSNICISCHGFPPSGGPERAEGDPRVIQGAINTRAPMNFLRDVLTPSDIVDVAAYLLSLSQPATEPAVPAFDYTDLWWNPAESGWGLNLIQHPSRIIFGVWYTYGADGKRTWFVMPDGTWTSSNTYSGPLYSTAGPSLAQSFDASKVRVSPVGNATLTFSDANHGTFAFSVNGVSGTKRITRQPF